MLALLSAGASRAQPCDSTAACLRLLEAAQRQTRTITADFVQVKHLSLLDEPLVSSGRFVFKWPDRMLLQVERPQPATVVVNGSEVQIPNLPERERQAVAMAPIAAMFTHLGAIFTGSVQGLGEGVEVVAAPDGAAVVVKLVPRQEKWQRWFRALEIRFAGRELVAETIRLEDGFGDRLEITLRNVQRNADVPDALFAR